MIEIRMPQLGLTMTEGTITAWFKQEGDTVAVGDPFYEVETDKLTNEITSEADGVLRKIIATEGAEVPVQGLLALVGDADEPLPATDDATPHPAAQEAPPQADPTEVGAAPVAPRADGRVRASGLAKKLATAQGVDLSQVTGTGPGGRIVATDVERAAATPTPTPAAAPVVEPVEAVGTVSATDVVPRTRVEHMSSMRRSIARNMLASWTSIPVVHYHLSVDTTALATLKADIMAACDKKVTFTDIIAKLTAAALMDFPALNCSVVGDDIVYHDYVNLGVAVALPDGLVVPVITDTQAKGISVIADENKDHASRARSGGLTPDELTGGTFTISNIGMYGIDTFDPIVNGAEVAILGIGAIVQTPVALDGEVVVRPRMTLSLTADHRAADGAITAQFLDRLRTFIENPWRTLV